MQHGCTVQQADAADGRNILKLDKLMKPKHAMADRFRLRWKFPSQCVICHAWPAERICHACRQAHAPMQLRCAGCALLLPISQVKTLCTQTADEAINAGSNSSSNTRSDDCAPAQARTPSHKCQAALCADCLRQPLAGVDACYAAVSYAWPWQQCVDGFKFGAQTGWSHAFAELMLQNTPAQQTLRNCDWLIPMPLHPLRLAERGFNQSQLLAQSLRAAAHRQHPLLPHQAKLNKQALLRVRHTQTQSRLPLAARLRNMHRAFAVAPGQAAELAGRRIVLVDDVMTSGASVLAASQALRNAGVAHVQVLVFARTEKS